MIEYWIIGFVLALYWIIMIPVQYKNIAEVKKELKKSGFTHNEMNDSEGFEEQQLKFNLQGNLFNLPATLVAQLIYVVRHRSSKKTK